jgi:hypothetical protein
VIRRTGRGGLLHDFAATLSEVTTVAGHILGRNKEVFLEQLKLEVWLLYAKCQVRDWQRELRAAARRARKLSRENP